MKNIKRGAVSEPKTDFDKQLILYWTKSSSSLYLYLSAHFQRYGWVVEICIWPEKGEQEVMRTKIKK